MSMSELIDRARPSWMRRSECRTPRVVALIGTGKVDFFPPKGKNGNPAKTICAACPVRAECLAYAMDRWELHGIWGGTGMGTRQRMRAERRRGEAVA